MNHGIAGLTDTELAQLIDGLRHGTIAPNASPLQLARANLPERADVIATWLAEAFVRFGTIGALLASLQLLQADRRQHGRSTMTPDVVMTGPGLDGDEFRDTRVVIREILESARHSALIVGYAFYDSAAIFEPLARRMGTNAAFQTRIILNIHPIPSQPPARSIARTASQFTTTIWPFRPRPEVYYLPESMHLDSARRASVHAKLVVVDDKTVYIGSANFTSAAFQRNIEIGVRLHEPVVARKLLEHFNQLIISNIVVPLILDEDGSAEA